MVIWLQILWILDINRRSRGGMNPRDNKNMSGNRIEFRFLIPSKAASVIIGKGGERIQRLRHECNARLSIPDNHGPERVFVLESTIDNCIKVWQDCLPELKECLFPNMDSRRGSGSFREDGPEIDLRFLVHDSQVGAIIGKGGVNVKNLRMQYQLNVIKVFPITAPFSSDRVVQMIGTFDHVFDCFRVIYDTLEGQSIKGHVENYNSSNFDETLMAGYGGWCSNNQQTSDNNNRKPNPAMSMDRNTQQNGRFNNRPNEQFFPTPDLNRMSNPQQLFNRFDDFNDEDFEDAPPEYDMDNDNNFPVPFNNRLQPLMNVDPNFSGVRKRNNVIDMEPDNVMKRGRMGMNNLTTNPYDNRMGGGVMDRGNMYENRNERATVFDNRNDRPNNPYDNRMERPVNPYENRNEKTNPFEARNDKSNFFDKVNRMDNNVIAPISSGTVPINLTTEKMDVSIPLSLLHAVKGPNGEVLSNIINDSGASILILDHDSAADAILSLTGTKDQIDGAQYLLQICIKKSVLNL